MDTPALAQLMGAYLHQDSDMVGTTLDNIDLFITEDPQVAASLPDEIDRVLETYVTDDEIKHLVKSLGCQIAPIPEGSYRAWLASIGDHARAVLAGR